MIIISSGTCAFFVLKFSLPCLPHCCSVCWVPELSLGPIGSVILIIWNRMSSIKQVAQSPFHRVKHWVSMSWVPAGRFLLNHSLQLLSPPTFNISPAIFLASSGRARTTICACDASTCCEGAVQREYGNRLPKYIKKTRTIDVHANTKRSLGIRNVSWCLVHSDEAKSNVGHAPHWK